MRVALVAPFVSAIDDRRPQLGGAQTIVAELATGLAARGHAVTVLAARGSHVAGATVVELVPPDPDAAFRGGTSPSTPSQTAAFEAAAGWLAAHRADVDVVHAHAFDAPAFALLAGPRALHTIHLPPLDPAVVAAARGARATLATVSASARDAWRAAGVPVERVLPNGIAVDGVPEGRGDGGTLAFAGRLTAEKGADAACRIARSVGLPLRIAGDRYDEAYFTARVAPLLGGGVEYVGALDRAAVLRFLGAARATLMPVRWDEPFGMVALESLAAGTPVVAYARGGLGEIVTDRRSGRLVRPDDEPAFGRAVVEAVGLDRTACRADARRFDLVRMLEAHERLYAELVSAS